MTDLSKKIMNARTDVILDNTFFGSLIMRLKLEESRRNDTCWTDGVKLGYNPDFFGKLSHAEIKGVFIHEILHCVYDHPARCGNRDHQTHNEAADYVINYVINKMQRKVTLPPGCLYDARFEGMDSDEVYTVLWGEKRRKQQEQDQDGQDQAGQDQEGDEPGQDHDEDGSGSGSGDGTGKPDIGDGSEENQDTDTGGCGAFYPPEIEDEDTGKMRPMNKSEREALSDQWKTNVIQAANAASKAEGDIPGFVRDMVQEIYHPAEDWRHLLTCKCNEFDREDYDWMTPDRRYNGIILPDLNSPMVGDIIIAVDTSGSVGAEEKSRYAAEIGGILETMSQDVTVLYCDTEVRRVQEFSAYDRPLVLEAEGGGGTDFIPVFEWIEKNCDRPPKCLIYLTDLECSSYPENAPDYDVLWVTDSPHREAPFGEIIRVKI